jgi:hypothetical protein
MLRRTIAILLAVMTAALLGCVERRLTVNSNPPGARVYLNGEEKGITPVTFRFDWYGQQEFLLRKDGYRVLREVRDVNEPLYEKPVINVFADLGPLPITDHKTVNFNLEPITEVKPNELLDRANGLKFRMEKKPIPARTKAFTSPKPETPVRPPIEPETTETPSTEPPPEIPIPDETSPGVETKEQPLEPPKTTP